MHQTFYIDIDEEITSIVERLRNARAKEVVVVVPKRALLIQSIINLKLLKKEADALDKEIIIVTQDKFGKALIEKAGMAVEQKLDDVSGEEIKSKKGIQPEEIVELEDNYEAENKKNKRGRLDTIGSDEFFDRTSSGRTRKEIIPIRSEEPAEETEKLTNKELVTDISSSIKDTNVPENPEPQKKFGVFDLVKNMDIRQRTGDDQRKEALASLARSEASRYPNKSKAKKSFFKKEKPIKETEDEPVRKIKSMQEKPFDYNENVKVPGKFLKTIFVFSVILIIIASSILAYLFLPKASVSIFVKQKPLSSDMEVTASVNAGIADFGKKIIPAKIIEVDQEISDNFSATGEKASSSHKARGMITIYNDYSSAPQTLVATTRFQSEDGKIFRLIKGLVIPGMTQVGGEPKSGAIEAEVMADETGDQYNIGPTRFTIPGFQGSGNEKYAKFYAKSSKPMTGGGSGTDQVKSISEADINSAKAKLGKDINNAIKQKIKEQAGEDQIVLDDALNISSSNYNFSNSVGEVADNFTATLKTSASAIVFSNNDLKSVADQVLAGDLSSSMNLKKDSLSLDFGKTDADFAGGTALLRVHATGKADPNLDISNIRKGILGKNEEELEEYLKTYPDVLKVEVEYWPPFISAKIPLYESRVEVSLDNN